MKTIALSLSVLFLLVQGMNVVSVQAQEKAKSFYDFTMKDIDGKEVKLADYKGKVLLVVNVASKCGYTPQYKELQELYKTYMDDGLVLLGFPANNYGGQEPGTDKEIKEFCSVNFKVSFPMFSKISVKGDDIHPLFKYLTTLDNKDLQGDIKWNFEKFLIGRDGKLLQRFPSKVTPMSDEMQNAVKKALEK